jgi:serine/threonine protein kinase/FKBP-type peptidyl-prolyl cis-trans isomerase
MIGEKIHHYIITRLIGEGGMATVYEAVHEKLQTKVAVKVLNPLLAANNNIRQRFENEARFMASLTHPNITRVIDYEERPDLLAIILEFLEGKDLGAMIKQNGPLPLNETIACFTQVLDAFDYAHSKGIVHRDVKPSNIFLEPSNIVKILDFGIAKLIGAGDDMTMTGTQIGTPVYMSPEQVNSDKTLDHRSDIYSLGVTLYSLLKGEPPYDTTTHSSFQIYTKIVHEPIPELVKYPEIDRVIRIATDKDRTKRYQTCREFRQALIAAVEPVKTSAPVDSEKTLIDIPEPVKPAPKPVIEQKEKKPPVEIKEKKEKVQAPYAEPKSKKLWSVLILALSVLGIIIFLVLKFYPTLFLQVFNPAELERRAEARRVEAKHMLDLGKAKLNKAYTTQSLDSVKYYLSKAAETLPDNIEVMGNLGLAYYKTNLNDSIDLPGLNYNWVVKASELFEKMIQINPDYSNDSVVINPYALITSMWGKLALKYMVFNQQDSVRIAFTEGRKRGGFNEVELEIARNSLNSCDPNALLFMWLDGAFYPVLYVQETEKLRTDVKPVITDFLERNWYFSYLKNKLYLPTSIEEDRFSQMTSKSWKTKEMTLKDAGSGESITWTLYDEDGKLTKARQLILDILTTNKFSKPVHFSIFFNALSSFSLNLGQSGYMIPEGLVNKLDPEGFQGWDKLQQTKLDNLSYASVKNTHIPSNNLGYMIDIIRYQYLFMADAFIENGDIAKAKIAKKQMEENLPFSNYPYFFKDIDTRYKTLVNILDYTDQQRLEKEKSEIREYMQKNNLTGNPTTSGLYYIETKAGSGPIAKSGNTVKVNYTLTSLDGTKFDSTYDTSKPFEFKLGAGQVIKGFEEGIAMMRLGSKGLLIIPYGLGYGKSSSGSLIPAYSTLVFEVELLDIN